MTAIRLAPDFREVLKIIQQGGIDFILIGGLAATVHGSARSTYDVDIVYSRSPENIERIAKTLGPYNPYPRGAPPGLPFLWDAETLSRGLNFTLSTTFGDLDLLGEIPPGGTYEQLVRDSSWLEVFGIRFLCLNLEKLIEVKRAAGRPKDYEAIAELEVILAERQLTS